MTALTECFLAGCATGAGVALMLCIPIMMRMRARLNWLQGWSNFWAVRNDRTRRMRL
jgi:hypothetical protein